MEPLVPKPALRVVQAPQRVNLMQNITSAPVAVASSIDELERTCFVIMPFGIKKVGEQEVDFTELFKELFEPAIAAATTPEGTQLIARRTDMDAFSSSINQDMYEYIMYSRLALADISGFNPNVFYEIGVRHAIQEAGTLLLRQRGHAIPFDIATIKVFEYAHQSPQEREQSRAFITQLLAETLKRNRLDSPVRLALRAQWGGPLGPALSPATTGLPQSSASPAAAVPGQVGGEAQWRKQEVDRFLRDAEEAVRVNDLEAARTYCWGALRFDPMCLIARMRLGLILKRQGQPQRALEEFITVTKLVPNYAEAWKEKGIAEGIIARRISQADRPSWLEDGSASLRRATMLNPEDFDAWASLGGVYSKVRNDTAAAYGAYKKSAEVSNGHPYPLLNALKLEAVRAGRLDIEAARSHLDQAESLRLGQTKASPPADTPWCFFDLAEIALYKGDKPTFLASVRAGLDSCVADWQAKTFRETLHSTLVAHGIVLDGLGEGLALLDAAIKPVAAATATA
jgi:tetratricopeptide (TPR) repeat protein